MLNEKKITYEEICDMVARYMVQEGIENFNFLVADADVTHLYVTFTKFLGELGYSSSIDRIDVNIRRIKDE